jgi:hypothetical protein
LRLAALHRLLRLAEWHLRNTRCGRTAVVGAARRLDWLPRTGRHFWLGCLLRRRGRLVDGLRAGRAAVGRGSRIRWHSRGPAVGRAPAAVCGRGRLGGRCLTGERFLEPADDRRLDCR